ncbi:hypothetical protein [uncultured Thalassolituus sp.]|uniref:hypothetical protein n=1 Tax=uncultured Thalassolituus sp. TaxID=285273 RepID=UPI002619FF27|nr:hypothetical protein [uncultured Thalassolituus sp.]
MTTGSELSQFAASLHVVRGEIDHALDHAAVQLDNYSGDGDLENLRAFLEEIRQLRGTFKMMDFRAGERLCEELTETVRRTLNEGMSPSLLDVCTQAIIYIKRYIEFVLSGQAVAPSLLVPTINLVRRERQEKPLPEGYFFVNNLRPKVEAPAAVAGKPLAFRKVRQMVQLGLLGMIRSAGRHGPVQVLVRALSRVEVASRGTPSWSFWDLALNAVTALGQESFELTPQRIVLVGQLDRMIRKLQETSGQSLQQKAPDWLLKELLYLVALAEPETDGLKALQASYHIQGHVTERALARSRQNLGGPDQSALLSFARALQDEIDALKDLIDRSQRNPDFATTKEDLIERMERISDTLLMVDMNESSMRADAVIRHLREGNSEINLLADDIIRIEQDVHALTQSNRLVDEKLVDPVTLREATISVIAESVSALIMVKRSVASYVDTNDKLHVKNVSKSLHDVSGAVVFLEKPELRELLLDLEDFMVRNVVETHTTPLEKDLDAFADAVTAIEYYMDTYDNPSAGGRDALKMAEESMAQLREGYAAG